MILRLLLITLLTLPLCSSASFPVNNKKSVEYVDDTVLSQQDNIIIAFVVSNYIYKVHFTRTSDENYIEILNSSVGSMWWSYANKYISKRIIKNWGRVLF